MSWNNNWIEAAPLYAQAETLFERSNRPSQALYAHVSQFIPRAEAEPLPALLVELERDLKLPAAREPETRLRILVIRGMIETNYDSAMAAKTWGEVQTLAERRGEFELMARAMGEQGIADFLLGDFSNAKKLVTRAWLTAKTLHDQAAYVRYASLYGAGLVELQRYDEALQWLDQAIDTANKDRGLAYPSIAINTKIDALRGLHRYPEALALADAAISRLPSAHLDAHLFQIETAKGSVYQDMGDWDRATSELVVALGYARHLQYWRGISQTGGLLAIAYERQNDLPAALASIDEAIDANTKVPQELYFSPRNLAIKAEILARMGRDWESHALYEKSMTLVDSFLATAPTPNVERALIEEMSQVYSSYYNVLCNEGDLDAGLKTIEQERGRIEVQALEHHELVAPHEPTGQEMKIMQINLELIKTDSDATRQRLAQSLYQEELQLDDSSLAGATARRPMAVRDIQRHLGPDELLLEYVLDDSQSSVLAITSRSLTRYALPSRKVLASLIAQYRRSIHSRKSDPELAGMLFTGLLGPVKEYAEHRSVIVVPDGVINLVPFAALMDERTYLVESHNFSVSPSATVLCLLRDREPSTLADRYQYVGVAAWTGENEQGPRVTGLLRAISLPQMRQLQPLPQTKKEVETIAGDFPAPRTLLLGPAATESTFKALPLDQYRVLHLALHGYADVEYPDRSALVFAPQKDGHDDGLLEVREVRNLHLKARLVTLSACNTGVGPVGEVDVADLGHAFIEAGAETVVSALWELDDQSTTQLMTSFYKNLASHQTKTEALKQAQVQMMQSGLAPYYWASFEIVGDPAGVL
ncbi:CHAT domain-containing protein [Silvibacterium bohemicum]|uniref:CHAT domain-containing protein n=1 Tax=Silvibacterium bohemicum TaxID=1577686 RepID=A0A841JVA5_9BACT|nr:CHAT domain-containing protein [Silvibacterium bohemicum]MBB6144397.1 CHAT domain-containing protein [Silvibacterium bohemicum]